MNFPRRPPSPIPVSILTGFLGAGKTTLLNHLLADPALAETIVLINEFGEIGLDHLFVEKIDGDMVLLSSGCLCCTIRGDLVASLEDLLRRRDNDRIKRFNRVLIETTGLADPAPILHALMGHPYLTLRFRLDGIICVIDAMNGAATLAHHKEAARQAAIADRIVLSKTDLVENSEPILADLRRLNPSAPIFDAAKGEAKAQSLLNAGLFDPERKIPDVANWLRDEFLRDEHHHDHDAHDHDAHDHAKHGRGHGHDANRHSATIQAFAIRRQTPLDPRAFEMFLELLRAAHGPKLLRVKGIVALADDPARPVVIHGVQHMFHPPARLNHWPDSNHDTRIVFILDGLDRNFVEGLFGAAFNEIQTDRPDAAALFDNPLKPASGGLLA